VTAGEYRCRYSLDDRLDQVAEHLLAEVPGLAQHRVDDVVAASPVVVLVIVTMLTEANRTVAVVTNAIGCEAHGHR